MFISLPFLHSFFPLAVQHVSKLRPHTLAAVVPRKVDLTSIISTVGIIYHTYDSKP